MKCKICNNGENNRVYDVKEMMFGFKESFQYLECQSCGCLQLINPPSDMTRYYPENYYSMASPKRSFVKDFFRAQRDRYAVFGKGILGKILYLKFPPLNIQRFGKLREIGFSVNLNWSILDVGCGVGASFLSHLKRLGFKNLYGVDPFLPGDIERDGLTLLKSSVLDLKFKKRFDCITLFHSFEHIKEQREVLEKIGELLKDNGVCIIAIPVKSDYIWQRYKTYWVQIDAPRHYFLHTLKSFQYLIENSKFKIIYSYCDSTDFQFWGSEQYRRGIPLLGENSYAVNPEKSGFSKSEIESFKRLALYLNREREGDQFVFYLKKIVKGEQ